MARLPTVRLKGKDGKIITVNAATYASNIEGWLAKGFKLVGEDARMEPAAVIDTGESSDPPEVDLGEMTKTELVTWARESLDLILDPAMKKADMIAAIRESTAPLGTVR